VNQNEQRAARVAFYTRVSTASQTTDNQIIQLQQVADARGWTVVRTFADVASGAKDRRPALDEMMKLVRRGQVDLVAVAALDRLGRNTRHLVNLVEEFRQLGVALYSYRETLDTSSPVGALIVTVFAALAQFERDVLRERTLAGLARVRAQGRRLGRPPCVAVDVAEARRLIAEGVSKKRVAVRLGVPRTTLLRALGGCPETYRKKGA
jgi:DNA invertase Pin-like site-specific DNA recombinase